MQVMEENGHYRKPEPLASGDLDKLVNQKNIRRVLVFPAYGENGKPTPELRRAWRRWRRKY